MGVMNVYEMVFQLATAGDHVPRPILKAFAYDESNDLTAAQWEHVCKCEHCQGLITDYEMEARSPYFREEIACPSLN